MFRSNRSATERCVARRSERGSGLLSSIIGLGIVIALIGTLANVAIGLWTRTTVDSVAYQAARQVATSSSIDVAPGDVSSDGTVPMSDSAIEDQAIDEARALLGRYGNQVSMEFLEVGDPQLVVLHVTAPGASLLPRLVKGGPVVGSLDRRIVVRRESPR